MEEKKNLRTVSRIKNLSDGIQQRLNDIARHGSTVGMSFDDLSSFDFGYEKGKLKSLPDKISSGVKAELLTIGRRYTKLRAVYDPGGYIVPHKHSDNELIVVRKGRIKDMFTGQEFCKGQKYLLRKNTPHHLVSEEGAELTMYFTANGYINELVQLVENQK